MLYFVSESMEVIAEDNLKEKILQLMEAKMLALQTDLATQMEAKMQELLNNVATQLEARLQESSTEIETKMQAGIYIFHFKLLGAEKHGNISSGEKYDE